jgi:hypothetical protein
MSKKEENVWGHIIVPSREEFDELDPIKKLIREQAKIRAEKWTLGTLQEFKENKKQKLAQKEKEIWDAIYMKNMKVAP